MSCTAPLVRCETYETYRNQKGGISYKVEWGTREQYDLHQYKHMIKTGKYRKVQLIGCGQCLECRMNTARQKASDMMLELKMHNKEECFFLTFTYNDEHIPFHETMNEETGEIILGKSLRKEDMQKLWKRIRKKNPNLRYVCSGEYGGETNRPHMHAIVYSLKLNKSKFKRVGINEWGQPLYQSDEMDRYWMQEHITNGQKWYSKIGNVTIAEVSWESCNYVARYTIKKTTEQQDPNFHPAQGQINEYITQSKNIGLGYYEKNKNKIWESDTIPILNKKTGKFVKPTRKLMKHLKEENEQLYNLITEKRKAQAETAQTLLDQNTDLTREEQREVKKRLNQSYVDWRKDIG